MLKKGSAAFWKNERVTKTGREDSESAPGNVNHADADLACEIDPGFRLKALGDPDWKAAGKTVCGYALPLYFMGNNVPYAIRLVGVDSDGQHYGGAVFSSLGL